MYWIIQTCPKKKAKKKKKAAKKTAKKKDDPKDRLRKRYSSFARRMHQIDAEDIVER